MVSTARKKSIEDYFIDIFAYTFMSIMALMTLLPFLNVLSKSLSEEWAVVSGKVNIFPVGFQLDTMKYVATTKQFINSLEVSVFITVIGTLVAVLLTAVTAYPLSKKNLPGLKYILLLFVFTMLFSGGLIPNYLLMKKLDLINNLAVLILPSMISVFNMLVIKNYYESLPESLEESAKLDGASNITILFRIIIPLSTPVMVTISLFYAVGFWNEFFNGMIYISRSNLKPLQVYLRDIMMDAESMLKNADEMMNISAEGVRAGTIIASTIPILLVYPYLQKYFIKGILIGSVKG